MASLYSNKKGGWQLRLDWTQDSQNVAGNYSTVTARLYLVTDSSWNVSSGSFTGYININGNSKTISANPSNGGGTTVALGTHTVTISHNADGTKSFTIGFSYNLGIYSGTYGGTVGWLEGAGSGSLTTILRAYEFTVSTTTPVIGTVLTINVKSNGSGMNPWVYIAFGTKYISLGKVAVGTDVIITPPLDAMAPEIPNAKLGNGTIYVETWTTDDRARVGSYGVQCMFSLPSSVAPTIGTYSTTEQNSKVSTMLGTTGTYIQGNSKLKFTIATTPKYGASITKTEITAGGRSFLTDTVDLAAYDVGTGNVAFKATITDSRGYTDTKILSLPVLAYSPPLILSLSIARATGTNATITKSGQMSSIKIGTTEKNTYTALTQYRVSGTSTWATAKTETNAFANFNLQGFDVTKSYDIQVTLTDKLNSITAATFLTTTSTVLHFHGRDKVGVGKMWERGTMDVGGDIYMNNKLLRDIFYPIGTIYQSTSATNPSTFMGGTWERYGKGKVLVSLDEADADFATVSKTGGEKTHTLSVTEMPAHDHRSTTNAGYYVYGGETSASGPANGQGYSTRLFDSRTDSAGSSTAHNNLQPYQVVYTWRRTA